MTPGVWPPGGGGDEPVGKAQCLQVPVGISTSAQYSGALQLREHGLAARRIHTPDGHPPPLPVFSSRANRRGTE